MSKENPPQDNTIDQASAAVRRLDRETTPLTRAERWQRTKRTFGIVALTAVGATIAINAAPGIVDALKPATFSEETTTVSFDGDEIADLYDAVESIPGSEHINTDEGVAYISNMPENKEALSDGVQLGETISVPAEITK